MIDMQEDKKAAELWLEESDPEQEMDVHALVYLAATGFQECPGFCASRDYCEGEACFCKRAVFPSFEHYTLYESLRELYLKWAKLAVLSGKTKRDI